MDRLDIPKTSIVRSSFIGKNTRIHNFVLLWREQR